MPLQFYLKYVGTSVLLFGPWGTLIYLTTRFEHDSPEGQPGCTSMGQSALLLGLVIPVLH